MMMIEGEETLNCEIPNLQKFPMPILHGNHYLYDNTYMRFPPDHHLIVTPVNLVYYIALQTVMAMVSLFLQILPLLLISTAIKSVVSLGVLLRHDTW
jgi:hypothetical protein